MCIHMSVQIWFIAAWVVVKTGTFACFLACQAISCINAAEQSKRHDDDSHITLPTHMVHWYFVVILGTQLARYCANVPKTRVAKEKRRSSLTTFAKGFIRVVYICVQFVVHIIHDRNTTYIYKQNLDILFHDDTTMAY